jgi:phosphoribosyl 1,2-cyclic phosphate phosphodiesterase
MPAMRSCPNGTGALSSKGTKTLKLTILGSATSMGVPVIGCDCPVCTSADPRDRRTRTSAFFQEGDRCLLIDTSTDFRFQALQSNLSRVDAVLLTHAHADHISGLDDLRVFNFRQRGFIPVYGTPETIEQIQIRFNYIFQDTQIGGGKPLIELLPIDAPFEAAGFSVTPIPMMHGEMEVLGFRVGNAAYCTDVSRIPDASMALLNGLDVLVIDALRRSEHPTHFSLDQALDIIQKVKPKKAYLTHLTHGYMHAELLEELPKPVEPAYDGLVIEL